MCQTAGNEIGVDQCCDHKKFDLQPSYSSRKKELLKECQNLVMTRCEINNDFKNCPKLFENKIPQSTTEYFTRNSSVAYEPSDPQLFILVIKSNDLKFKSLLFRPQNSKKKSSNLTSGIFYYRCTLELHSVSALWRFTVEVYSLQFTVHSGGLQQKCTVPKSTKVTSSYFIP